MDGLDQAALSEDSHRVVAGEITFGQQPCAGAKFP